MAASTGAHAKDRAACGAMKIVFFIRIAGAALVALVVCACETLPESPFPRATEVGWWNDEGASGPARIIVHVGEQKAYFYKGKRLVGESTVSTGKPGFSTPPEAILFCQKAQTTSQPYSAITWMIMGMW